MSRALNWEASSRNRRALRAAVTDEQAKRPAIARGNMAPTAKQYALLRKLCERHNTPYTPPATRRAASAAIDALMAKKHTQ